MIRAARKSRKIAKSRRSRSPRTTLSSYPFAKRLRGAAKQGGNLKALTGIEAPLMGLHVVYVMRPLPRTNVAIREFIEGQLPEDHFIATPFASVHVRYGDKQKQESQTEGLNGQRCHVKYLYDSTKV